MTSPDSQLQTHEEHDQEAALGSPELLISTLLRTGVVASLGLVLVGMALTLLHHPDYWASSTSLYKLSHPDQVPHQLSSVLDGVRAAKGQAVTMAGLLLLIALPVTRVALSLWVFARQRDRAFMRLTAAVLLLLLVSFLFGRVE